MTINRLRAIRRILVALGTFCAVVTSLDFFWWHGYSLATWVTAFGALAYAALVTKTTLTIRRRRRA
jgi:hypothetical protein